MRIRNCIAIGLLLIGSLQMVGYLFKIPVLRGIGLASGIAPFPKVFCESEGYEGFASSFALEGIRLDGTPWELKLTPETYSQIRGPYNRRNVYGALFAYAPRLDPKARETLLKESLSEGSPIRKELQIPSDLREIHVVITPRPGEEPQSYRYTLTFP